MTATPRPVRLLLTLLFMVSATVSAGRATARAAWQEPGKAKDEALDALIEKFTTTDDKPASKSEKTAGTPSTKKADGGQKSEPPASTARKSDGSKPGAGAGPGTGAAKPADPPRPPGGAGAVSSGDQELDSLLEKLGETKDAPTAREGSATGAPAPGERPKEPAGAPKSEAGKLAGKDHDLDERLEELTGRKKKRSGSDDERGGAVGEIIKEMRDVEKRLGKPDPSEETRGKQKQIVKRIDTLIEQVKQSQSSAGRLAMKRVRQSGQQPGDEPGDQQGALARGAPPMKPAKPTSQHSTAGGRDIWGHLPLELRQIMDNSFREQPLEAKAELISRYFLSISKGKLHREE